MDALDMALRMWPAWMLGFFMIMATILSGNKDLLRVSKPAIIKWTKILGGITLLRILLFYFTWDLQADKFETVSWLPWQTCTMVWWEDAVYTLPLLLLYRLIGTSKKTWPIHAIAFLMAWVSFGSGHMYQGAMAAIFISFYIPYTLRLSKSVGLGTIMIGHVMYDLATILLIQTMIRFM